MTLYDWINNITWLLPELKMQCAQQNRIRFAIDRLQKYVIKAVDGSVF